MLRVVQFEDNRLYGIQNMWTGVTLSENDKPLEFRTMWGARRRARKLTRDFNKAVRNVTNKL